MGDVHIVIVGGGVAGVVAARWLLHTLKAPYQITLLERYGEFGGVWDVSREYGVMEFTVCNVSKYVMELAGFPWPADAPHFPHQTAVLAYIRDYALQFLDNQSSFTPLFNCEVTQIMKCGKDGNHGNTHSNHGDMSQIVKCGKDEGFWTVMYHDTVSQSYKSVNATHVIVANGHSQVPHFPVPDWDKFDFVSHSCHYKSCTTNGFLNKAVLVVGLSFSAVDVALDLVDAGQNQVTVLTRSGSWFSKKTDRGVPSDMLLPRVFTHLPYAVQSFLLRTLLNLKYYNQNNWQISNKTDPTGGNLVASERFVELVKRGNIRVVRGSISRVNSDKTIELSGSSAEVLKVDNVIFCTGYIPSFDFLSDTEQISGVVSDKTYHSNLYLNMISPDLGARLAFVGLFNVKYTSPFQVIDLQGRYIAKLIAGDISLPNKDTMLASISDHVEYLKRSCKAFRASLFLRSDYRDVLAGLVGGRPHISLLLSPKLWIQYYLGSVTWAGYCLNEQELQDEAAQALSGHCEMVWGKYWFCKVVAVAVLIGAVFVSVLVAKLNSFL